MAEITNDKLVPQVAAGRFDSVFIEEREGERIVVVRTSDDFSSAANEIEDYTPGLEGDVVVEPVDVPEQDLDQAMREIFENSDHYFGSIEVYSG